MNVRHLNCGILHAPPYPQAACHCLLVEGPAGLVLVDTGIGLSDVANPLERIGQLLIDMAGFQFHEGLTAARQVEGLGFRVSDVTDIVLTHGDPDHTGGLADFASASVHLAEEELAQLQVGHPRYLPAHFAHRPRFVAHGPGSKRLFGLEVRPIATAAGVEVLLVPLAGHTLGHSGVAVHHQDRWLLHAGDAYYLRPELETDNHPVSALAAMRAEDDSLRRESLAALRRLARDHAGEVAMFGYHDFAEFPPGTATRSL